MESDRSESLTLYPNRLLGSLAALSTLVTLALGIWFALRVNGAIGLTVVGLGGIGFVLSLVWLAPSRSFLHLGPDGLRYSTMFNPKHLAWSEVGQFGLTTIEGVSHVGWDYVDHYPADVTPRAESKKRYGYEAILPICCRTRPDQLVPILEARRRLVDRR